MPLRCAEGVNQPKSTTIALFLSPLLYPVASIGLNPSNGGSFKVHILVGSGLGEFRPLFIETSRIEGIAGMRQNDWDSSKSYIMAHDCSFITMTQGVVLHEAWKCYILNGDCRDEKTTMNCELGPYGIRLETNPHETEFEESFSKISFLSIMMGYLLAFHVLTSPSFHCKC